MKWQEKSMTTNKTFTTNRRHAYDQSGVVYEEKPRSAVVAGYVEAGTEFRVMAEQKGRIVATDGTITLAFHENHLKTKDEAKAAAALKAAGLTGTTLGLGLGVQKPAGIIERLQQAAARRKALIDELEAVTATIDELKPLAQAELEALNELTNS